MTLPEHFPRGAQVSCNLQGRVIRADVVERTPTGVRVTPSRDLAHHHVTARQVTAMHLPAAWDPARSQIVTEAR